MTVFDDRFTNHAVFATLGKLRTQLDAAEEHLSSTDIQEHHTRLMRAADYIERVLNSADPFLTSHALLNALDKSLQSAANEVEGFVSTQQPPQLVNANTRMDSALQQAAAMNVPLVPKAVEGLRTDIANFRNSATHHLRNFEKAARTARKSLEQKLEAAQQGINQTTSQIEAKLNEVESTRKAIETSKQQFQGQFSEAQDRRSTEFTESEGERTKQFQEFLTTTRGKLDEELKALTKKAGEYIEELKLRRAEVQKLVGAIGADALSGGFNAAAVVEKKAADRWRWAGVALFVLAIVAAGLLFGPLHEATELSQIGAKAVIVFPLVGLGTYAFKESGMHRRVQWRNRRLAIELASIDPYLALFEDGERNTVKKALVERWFAQPESPGRDDDHSPSAAMRIVEQALELLGKKS